MTQANADSVPLTTFEPRTGSEVIYATHNFCDPTTWYSTSSRIATEELSDAGAGLVWTSAHPRWVDLSHGKVLDEDALCLDVDHGYAVDITVNGILKTQREPFATSGGDYTVNYLTGVVTFEQSQVGNDVRASYSYATSSVWILRPVDGSIVNVEATEAQFSADCILNDTIDFEVWVYNPEDLPNKVMYARTAYKRMVNFVDEALGSYPPIPIVGGALRGTQSVILGFPFRYGTVRRLDSSTGTEVRVRLRSDTVFVGEHATATFYCTVRLP
jgi:hypothetical protein